MIFKRLRKTTNGDAHRGQAGPSIISADVVIDGSLVTAGELQIDGTVNGSVRAHSCVVDMQGVVQGEIVAEEVYVRGRVIGPIRGNHVQLHAGAHVEGDVINQTIAIENGAYIYGSIRRSENPMSEPANAPSPGYTPVTSLFGQNTYADEAYRPLRAIRSDRTG
jgi:cytoskeletal protein CcmA (bactofilin family)